VTSGRTTSLCAATALLLVVAIAGCGTTHPARVIHTYTGPLPADYLPLTLGAGRDYRPAAASARVRTAKSIDGLKCATRRGVRYGAHIEMFAHRHVIAIPAGIGIAPPLEQSGAHVLSGRCYYPAITTQPTGVIELRDGARLTLGELFDIWGQPLSTRIVGSFSAASGSAVVAYFDGRRWQGDARAIPLQRHALIVLEVGGHVPPHLVYLFPPGL
jgi:hypothetical protein